MEKTKLRSIFTEKCSKERSRQLTIDLIIIGLSVLPALIFFVYWNAL